MDELATNELRDQLGRRIDQAHYRGEHTIVKKNGEPRAVLVPYQWWQKHQHSEEATG
ncbi:type II toxin-antitoxin system Phd/YefM family antitoxin [Thermobifida halotolerans]|uniref:Antitoxin n=1 Tax=Thermobifida halotolerans TaxID=483545 RepID=A0AA97M4W1_9ACTN|nr:type II toxin-antitoxin system Phd/YefM family antitoxin [Thermobifida halotolerans]UOE20531.1 type II toxin-antitoxin system Phd/YefM family antitoxin [Thermobifida halotolerans]